ncbi:lysophospholipid acyltransferase family protein [Streptomyces microflavus]|uniref:1-acyl-sn-glycerol-3-phosphate acyltransferase n=2 Tax=Streptomyces microflavus TaxID=1919 RepID=A0A7H8MF88_STRMI|nr:lysophospholipid acyltransferase family protein [Streptomyces microflavus]QKW41189.1 1-acyl-sn-glycerol-3-phosphate acyltransferase [Streptomyces microflavus]
MLSSVAAAVIPCLGRLTVTSDDGGAPAPGSIIVANHTSLADPGVVLAALLRLDVEPVVLATAGLWRIPVLGRLLERGGHVPVHRATHRAADALGTAAAAIGAGRHVLIYGEGRLPLRTDAAEAPPESFRSGIARLAHASGAPVVPLGQAGARRVTSGSGAKQIAGFLTAPARRPRLHVHLGSPVHLPPGVEAATAAAREAVTTAWCTAARHLGEPAAALAAR